MIPEELAAAILHEPHVGVCAKQSGASADAYVARAFQRRDMTIRDGSRMTILVATDPCLTLGPSTRIVIFKRGPSEYNRVLDAVTLPGLFQVSKDGSVMLPTHESMETIFEAEYVWNGNAYIFSPNRSHIYDVPLGVRRPYRVPVRFPAGASSTMLAGSVALNFGQGYVFEARAGQSVTIDLTRFSGRRPNLSLWLGEKELPLNDVGRDRSSTKLPKSGLYELIVFATSESDATRVSTYAIRLSITP
jgi:hypothetical protein